MSDDIQPSAAEQATPSNSPVQEPVATVSEAPKVEEKKDIYAGMDVPLPVDVTFTDEHVAAITGVGLDPGEVRQEIGLETVARKVDEKTPTISCAEAIKRALVKYPQKV